MAKKIKQSIIQIPALVDNQPKIYDAWNNPKYKLLVASCGRQVGKTTTACYMAIKSCFILPKNVKNVKIGYFMPSHSQCKITFEKILEMLGEYSGVSANKSSLRLTFPNGSYIQFKTTANENFRGFKCDYIFLDEAAYIPDSIYEKITACNIVSRSAGIGKTFVLSTPRNKNWFYNLFTEQSSTKFTIKFTSYETRFIEHEVLDEYKKTMSKDMFANEYLGEFITGNSKFFDIERAITINTNTASKDGRYAAIDWGMENDYTVLTIINNKKEVCFYKKWRQIDWQVLIQEIAKTLMLYGNPICYSESNGIGDMPTKELQKIYPKTKKFVTTAANKKDILTKLSMDLLKVGTKDLLKVPNDIEYLKEFDNVGFKYENDAMKFFNIDNKIHDDCVMSLAIANFNFTHFSTY